MKYCTAYSASLSHSSPFPPHRIDLHCKKTQGKMLMMLFLVTVGLLTQKDPDLGGYLCVAGLALCSWAASE